jgi:hypothetical protein
LSSTKSEKRVKQVLARSGGWGVGRGKVSQTMYTHVSKCKNDKIKESKKKKKRILHNTVLLMTSNNCINYHFCPWFRV